MGSRTIGILLVVPQHDVEAGFVALDQVALKNQGFELGSGHHPSGYHPAGGRGRRSVLFERHTTATRARRRQRRGRMLGRPGASPARSSAAPSAAPGSAFRPPTSRCRRARRSATASTPCASHVDGERHDAAAYLGTRPTFDDGMPVLEIFLFDFDGDLYGREIEVEFIDHIRGDRKFDSSEALVAQMQTDIAKARAILAAATIAAHRTAIDRSMQSCQREAGSVAPRDCRMTGPAGLTADRRWITTGLMLERALQPASRDMATTTAAKAPPKRSTRPAGHAPAPARPKPAIPAGRGGPRLEQDAVPAADRLSDARRPAGARAEAAEALGTRSASTRGCAKRRKAAPSSCCTTARPTPTATSTSATR